MTDRLERLINLVIALREARVPLTAADVRERVAGYGGGRHEAFRRMFERDKADLRALGVPVETAPLDVWGDRQGYRIDPARYDLPELALEPDEIAALAVAVEAAGVAGEAAGGLRKLAAGAAGTAGTAAAVPPDGPPPTSVDVALDDPRLPALVEAQATRTPVRFRYRAAEGEVTERTVEPHGLVHRHGRWYLVGHDRDRGARRAFRLDRALGRIEVAGAPGAFDPPAAAVVPEDVVPEPANPRRTAEITASDAVAWQVATRARGAGRPCPDGRTAYRVRVGDVERFLSWVLGFGPEVEVVGPASLRAVVQERLAALARAHTAEGDGHGEAEAGATVEGGAAGDGPAAATTDDGAGGEGRPGPDGHGRPPAAGTLRRLERVLTMVPWLLEHPGASLEEIGRRFGATAKQVLADLDVLAYCGLPGYGGGDLVEVHVLGDRVSVHMADYFRRPLALTVREAVALLLAARALAGVTALPESGPLARAAAKLETLLGSEDPASMAVAVAEPAPAHLTELRRAVEAGEVVRVTYRSESRARMTEREVEPWRLTASGGGWYLQGWCRLADAPRSFRLDRIREVAATGERASAPAAQPAPPVYHPRPGDPRVVLDVAPTGWWLSDAIVVESVVERGDRRRIAFRAATLDWAARTVLRLGGSGRVVTPARLAALVRDLAGRTLAQYAP